MPSRPTPSHRRAAAEHLPVTACRAFGGSALLGAFRNAAHYRPHLRLLPPDQHGEISQLGRYDYVGLRFASDAELPDLFRRVRNGECSNVKEIKRAVKQWRPDFLRA